MSRAPWVKFYAGDFLNGVADLEADEIGIYMVALALMYERGGPIPDDSSWLARRSGSNTRKTTIVLRKLVLFGKLSRIDGMLINQRAALVIEEKAQQAKTNAKNAAERWGREPAPELPLGDVENGDAKMRDRFGNDSDNREINRLYSEDNLHGSDIPKPRKSAKRTNANASFPSHARAVPEPDSREESYDSSAHSMEKRVDLPDGKKGEKRAHRLPADWKAGPLTGTIANAVAAWPRGKIEIEDERFRDHWLATPGARACKIDWDAAWRNWLRKEDNDHQRQSARGQGKRSGWAFATDR